MGNPSPVQESKVNAAPQQEGAEQSGGLTMAPPAFGLTAGAAAGAGVAQRKVADANAPSKWPRNIPTRV
ncbi:MAG: hypothetical protein U0176_18985 [Bacteroidia bacterium]